MKKIFIAAVITTTFTTVFSSCGKDGTTTDPEATPSATITITSPAIGQTYRLGDTAHIVATIEGNVKMHGYHAVIVNTATGDTVYKAEEHTHEMKLNVEQHWCCSLSSSADLRLYISSALNHDDLEVVKTVDLKVTE
jgi:hypothetical protein